MPPIAVVYTETDGNRLPLTCRGGRRAARKLIDYTCQSPNGSPLEHQRSWFRSGRCRQQQTVNLAGQRLQSSGGYGAGGRTRRFLRRLGGSRVAGSKARAV